MGTTSSLLRFDENAPWGATHDHYEVNMLDVLYVGVVVAFFILLWGFTRAADRL